MRANKTYMTLTIMVILCGQLASCKKKEGGLWNKHIVVNGEYWSPMLTYDTSEDGNKGPSIYEVCKIFAFFTPLIWKICTVWMSHRKWNNWPNGLHWPVRPIIPFPGRHPPYPHFTVCLQIWGTSGLPFHFCVEIGRHIWMAPQTNYGGIMYDLLLFMQQARGFTFDILSEARGVWALFRFLTQKSQTKRITWQSKSHSNRLCD